MPTPTEPRTVRVVCPDCQGRMVLPVPAPIEKAEPCPYCDNGYIQATLIPLTDGQQVVVEKGALGNAADVLDGIVDDIVNDRGCGRDVTSNDVVAVLTALFPAGIEVAEAVGIVDFDCDGSWHIQDDVGGPSAQINGDERVALLRREAPNAQTGRN